MPKIKKLKPKQIEALNLLVSGQGLTYTEIADKLGINRRTLYEWINYEQHSLFQEELKRLEDERMAAIVDAAKDGMMDLVKNRNQKMIEFVMKNAGMNPAVQIDADITSDINIVIDDSVGE